MRKFINWKFLLLIIVILATFLRFYNLGTNPPSLTWDEAAWGYNAYSLGIDGKDEFGRFLPVDYLESFGDFKPPVYAYLDIIPVKIFGLNEFATRFPSALFGALTVLLTYFLVKALFKANSKSEIINPKQIQNTKYKIPNNEAIALLSAFFIAISPWHIMLSRAAFEANIATFFIVLGVWLFLLSVHGKRWILLFSVISFVLSIYTFNTARVVVPILVLILVFAFRKELLSRKKETFLAIILGIILILPTLQFLLSPQASLRFKEVNIFSDINVIKTSNQEIANDNNAFWSKLIHNRRLLYSVEYIKHYFDNLSPNFLFIKGDGNPKFSTQNVGQMYIWDIPFFVVGALLIFRRKEGYWWIVPLWLVIGIIPAATARETPHALRIETTLPTFQILTAYGFVQLYQKISKHRHLIYATLYLLLFLNFLYFYHDYLAHYPKIYSGEWQYGYKQTIDYVKNSQDKYDYIQITNALGRPYIYYLFYTKTDPSYFRNTAIIKREALGFVSVEKFGKYIFPKNYSYFLDGNKKVLYINTPHNLPSAIKILKTFYLLNGEETLMAYTYD